MNEQYKSLVNWYYIEDWSDYPGPKGRVVPNAEGYDNPSDYDGAELYISQGTIGDKEGNLFIDEEGNDVPFNSQYFEKTNPLKENKMNKEQLRMQMLAGIITEASDPKADNIALNYSNTKPNTPPGAKPGQAPKRSDVKRFEKALQTSTVAYAANAINDRAEFKDAIKAVVNSFGPNLKANKQSLSNLRNDFVSVLEMLGYE